MFSNWSTMIGTVKKTKSQLRYSVKKRGEEWLHSVGTWQMLAQPGDQGQHQ